MNAKLYRFGLTGLVLSLSLVIGNFATQPGPSTAREAVISSSRRWLAVQQLQGRVTYRGRQTRSARRGDRLTAVGQGLSTAKRSRATLAIDQRTGSLQVAQNTSFKVKRLAVGSRGEYITVLNVTRGQVRVRVQKFNNPQSRLELRTPSGVAGVRGTDFGASVTQTGQTNIGTLEGAVEATAQGEAVQVEAGFVSMVVPGQPPTAPQPLDRELDIQIQEFRREGRQVRVVATVAPGNTVTIADQEVAVDISGQINTTVDLKKDRLRYRFLVFNPLGEDRTHRIWLGQIDDATNLDARLQR